MENCRNARGCFSTGGRLVQSETRNYLLFYPDIKLIWTSNIIYLLDVCLKRCFAKFSFHFEGVLLAVRGCTCVLRGCSRTLKTPNSPPLDVIVQLICCCNVKVDLRIQGNRYCKDGDEHARRQSSAVMGANVNLCQPTPCQKLKTHRIWSTIFLGWDPNSHLKIIIK